MESETGPDAQYLSAQYSRQLRSVRWRRRARRRPRGFTIMVTQGRLTPILNMVILVIGRLRLMATRLTAGASGGIIAAGGSAIGAQRTGATATGVTVTGARPVRGAPATMKALAAPAAVPAAARAPLGAGPAATRAGRAMPTLIGLCSMLSRPG